MSSFSRLQLAKALIEYDNENLPPGQPWRVAEESAIFSALRRNLPSRQQARRRSTDYLGVQLPSDSSPHGDFTPGRGSVAARDSMFDSITRKSVTSIEPLHNPFGRDSMIEGATIDASEGMEVDLASWGLDALMDKEKKKGKGKQVQRHESASSYLPNPHPPLKLQDAPRQNRPSTTARTMSLSNIPFAASTSRDDLTSFGMGGAFLDAESSVTSPPTTLGSRRHSVGSPLDYANVHPSDPALAAHRRKASEHALIDGIPITPPLHAVPFPVTSPPLEGEEEEGLAYDQPEPDLPNPFSVQPPSPDRASRFDPKAQARDRAMSSASLGTQMLDLESPRPEDSISMMSPNPRSPGPVAGRDRPYSRLELMRPKLLVMPSPLQGSMSTPELQQSNSRAGFQISTDGPPLPPGAKTGTRGSAMDLLSPPTSLSPNPTGGDYFTLNPRASMTLSQLTFRNTLMVDGQRDVAFRDIDNHLRWATEDGEQVDLTAIEVPANVPTVDVTDVDATDADELAQMKREKRPAGKLYGKSLIDDLENRKTAMKSKQRVFTGDQRPSMMARSQLKRSSTLIDPESLKQRPVSTMVRGDSSQTLGEAGLSRRNSAHAKTLINFDDEIRGAPRGSGYLNVDGHQGGGMNSTRSVFGVDTLWEREMVKLREIEAQEKAEEEERRRRGETDDGMNKKKGKGKRKGKTKEPAALSPPGLVVSPSPSEAQDIIQSSTSAATSKRRTAIRALPPPVDGDDDEEDDASDTSSVVAGRAVQAKSQGWYSDEEADGGPRRGTGSGPRYANTPPRLRALQQQQYQGQPQEDEDSEEDLPLVATIGRAAQRATRGDLAGVNTTRLGGDSSDEEVPLSQLLDKTKLKLPSPTFSTNMFQSSSNSKLGVTTTNDDDDDQPLGLRVSRAIPSSHSIALSSGGAGEEDEDDRPLGMHPEQLRRSQFMMAAHQQQQQQQMMMQAAAAQMQMQQSMMFGAPSIMSAPFFGPPMAPPMMMPPQISTTPPPMHDTAKLTRVDKWRHDVAVEEER